MSTTNKPRRNRRTRSEVQAREADAFSKWISGLSFRDIDRELSFSGPGNAWRAVQSFLDSAPDPGNTNDQRKVENHRLDSVWRMAFRIAESSKSDAHRLMALRVLLETSRRRSMLNGIDKPTVLQIDGPGDTQQQAGPMLREVLPAEVVAEPRLVRQQALALHRALPAGEQAG